MPSILDTGNELAVKVAADAQKAEGEASLTASGGGPKLSWWARLKAKVTATKGSKPNASAEVEGGLKW